MTDIAVGPLQSTELPPPRVGEVKPPFSLADRSGEIGLALATAKFAGDRFNKVVQAKAANEHAAFQGIAAAEIEGFDTLVVSKPGASFDELESERNKMVARIEAAGKQATTKSAQQSNKNWMLRNKPNIYSQTQTSMEAIRTRQALDIFNVQRKNLITNFKRNELTDLYGGQVESGLMTEKFAKAQLAVDLDVLDAAEAKVAVGNASQVGFEAWQDTGNVKDGLDAIDAIEGLTGSDKDTAESEYKRRVANRQAEDTLELEAQQEEDRGTINEAMYVNKDYNASFDAINNSRLSEKEKRPLLKENEDRAKLAASGRSEANDPAALDKVTTAIAQLGNDTLPLSEAKRIFKENSRFLKATTADSLWKELIGEFDASVDTAAARVRGDVRLRAIGRTESALDRLLEALAGAPTEDQPALENRIATAREKFNLELANFNKWEQTQRAWRRANPDATPEQIQQEGMRSWFTEFAGKNVVRLRSEAKTGTIPGKKVPTSTLPNGKELMRKPAKKRATSRGGGVIPGAVFQVLQEDVAERLKEGWTREVIPEVKPEGITAERVRVVSPDGREGTVPADKVDQLPEGWKKL